MSMVASNPKTVLCSECGYTHLNPLPPPEKVEEYYDNDLFYDRHSPQGWLEKELREYNKGLWNVAYEYQLNLFTHHLPIIDIGSGLGTFVDFADRKKCWTAYGTEPSLTARRMSPAGNIVTSFEDLWHDKARQFEYGVNVRASLLLEHLHDPGAFLEKYRKILGPGRLMVIVPNEFSPLQKRVGGDWFVSDVHLNYFTPSTLRTLMYKSGLRVVHESATFPMELAIVLGIDYRGNDSLGRKVHAFRLWFEKVFPNPFRLYESLYRRYKWGRELIFVAEAMNDV